MIYICIPTYNEARTIGVLLWKIRQTMAEFPRDYQLLVVDDASTDATPEVLAPYTRVLPLTVHRNEERQGYAASLELLLREAVHRAPYPKRDVVVTLQADFTEEPGEIPSLVKRIEGGADVVTSSVTLAGDEVPRAIRWTRRLLGFLLRRADFPEEVTDPLSGFRAYRVITLRKALEARDGQPLVHGDVWTANARLLRTVLPTARRVDEVPLHVRYGRRDRATRFRAWETALQLLSFVRGSRNGTAEADGSGARVERRFEASVGTATPKAGGDGRRGGRSGASSNGGSGRRRARGGAKAAAGGSGAGSEGGNGGSGSGRRRRRRGGSRTRGRRKGTGKEGRSKGSAGQDSPGKDR